MLIMATNNKPYVVIALYCVLDLNCMEIQNWNNSFTERQKKIQGRDSSVEAQVKPQWWWQQGWNGKRGDGSSSSKLCNPECIIHHRWETSKEGFLDSFVVVKHQKELISKACCN